jgi:hypothetical protein
MFRDGIAFSAVSFSVSLSNFSTAIANVDDEMSSAFAASSAASRHSQRALERASHVSGDKIGKKLELSPKLVRLQFRNKDLPCVQNAKDL